MRRKEKGSYFPSPSTNATSIQQSKSRKRTKEEKVRKKEEGRRQRVCLAWILSPGSTNKSKQHWTVEKKKKKKKKKKKRENKRKRERKRKKRDRGRGRKKKKRRRGERWRKDATGVRVCCADHVT